MNSIRRLNLAVGICTKWLIVILSLVLTYDVIMRYLFNAPAIWTYDLAYMLGGAFFILGMGYTLMRDEHIRVDIFYAKWSRRTQGIIDVVLTLVLFLPTFTVGLYHMIPYVYRSWLTHERSVESFWRPPIYPIKTVLLFGVVLLFLQGIVLLVDSIRKIRS